MSVLRTTRFLYIPKENGFWVKVIFSDGSEWYPRLDDIGMICGMIGRCEDGKYPDGQGCKMPADFIEECMQALHKTKDDNVDVQLAIVETIYRGGYDPNRLYRERQ